MVEIKKWILPCDQRSIHFQTILSEEVWQYLYFYFQNNKDTQSRTFNSQPKSLQCDKTYCKCAYEQVKPQYCSASLFFNNLILWMCPKFSLWETYMIPTDLVRRWVAHVKWRTHPRKSLWMTVKGFCYFRNEDKKIISVLIHL